MRINVTRAHDKTPHFSHFATDVRHAVIPPRFRADGTLTIPLISGILYRILSYLV